MSKRIIVISDTQIIYHDRRALAGVIRCIGELQPDEVIHIGDVIDLPQPARWSKGTRAEFEGSVLEDSMAAQKALLEPLREVYDGPIGIHEGNHDLRARAYLEKYAPALAESSSMFNVEKLLDFEKFDVTLLPSFYEFAPDWVSTHGHVGGISLSRIAGNTALGAARKFNKSVVMGHTHRLGVLSETHGYGGKITKQLTGLEVGHLMDMKLAQYLKQSTANWQQGFGVLTIEGKHVKPEPIPITKGRFTVDGYTWEV
ncbi:hypothetical protein A5630_25310 [Mycolicibacterium mucogenicum]|uniref:Calcineurin-like phosphoesterase domain-containing protein n=1 Tax=Mycolicibacterium mucogenicum TaxID=56689 RepID=A0A1A3GW59_MYCMU|nr:metallophosphoesterase [Mycolicibacterium mucogenicum]OBJ40272.1 hypothetical protein A5630_25310 [Mycolicibacterium mucogenicum]